MVIFFLSPHPHLILVFFLYSLPHICFSPFSSSWGSITERWVTGEQTAWVPLCLFLTVYLQGSCSASLSLVFFISWTWCPYRHPIIPLLATELFEITLFSLSMDLPALVISNYCNHIICGLLCWLLIKCVFSVHPCYSVYQYSIPFCGWIMFHCVDIHILVIRSSVDGDPGFFFLAVMYNAAMNIPLCIFVWTYVFNSLGCILGVEFLDYGFVYFCRCLSGSLF